MEENIKYIEVIKDIMFDNNLSQQKFGATIGVNQTTVSQWLLGHKKPGYDSIYTICAKFGISADEFFGLK